MATASILSVVLLGLVIGGGGGGGGGGNAGTAPVAGAGAGADAEADAEPELAGLAGAVGAAVEPPAEWSLGHGYVRRGDHIHYDGQRIDEAGTEDLERLSMQIGRRLVLAHDVDAASFVALSDQYTKDTNAVYFKIISPGRFWVTVLPNADPATFEVLDRRLARDANRVWVDDVPIRGADPATAQVVPGSSAWKDRTHVYYQFERLQGADPATFRHVGQAFHRDANHVYWGMDRLEGADADTFRSLGNDVPYAVDANSVWSTTSRLPGVDPATCRLLHNHVYADKERVYVGTSAVVVPGADGPSFRKLTELQTEGAVLFRDRSRFYIFDPAYNEVFAVRRDEDGTEISKPVWYDFRDGRGPQLAATVSATWEDGGLTEPTLEMLPDVAVDRTPLWEIDKLARMEAALRETLAYLGEDVGDGPGGERGERGGAVAAEAEAAEQQWTRPTPEGPWNRDVAAFDAHLEALARDGRIPTADELLRRVRRSPMTEVMPLTMDMGGYMDLKPAADTVQHRVNRALAGTTVRWSFTLAEDASVLSGVTALIPDLGFDQALVKPGRTVGATPRVMMILVREQGAQVGGEQPPVAPSTLRAGDRVIVEGTIGDAETNQGISLPTFVGPIAVYHLGEIEHPVFWIGLEDATITTDGP